MLHYYNMNINKHFKPNLLDPIVKKRIVKAMNPPKDDYWAPTKTTARSFYQNYIKSNIGFFIVLVIFILFLFYRYRIIRKNRVTSEIEKTYKLQDDPNVIIYNTEPKIEHEFNQPPKKDIHISQKDMDEYAQLLMYLYEQQKDSLREPINKNYSSRMKPAKPNGPKFAYPVYPYANGGTLTPSGNK